MEFQDNPESSNQLAAASSEPVIEQSGEGEREAVHGGENGQVNQEGGEVNHEVTEGVGEGGESAVGGGAEGEGQQQEHQEHQEHQHQEPQQPEEGHQEPQQEQQVGGEGVVGGEEHGSGAVEQGGQEQQQHQQPQGIPEHQEQVGQEQQQPQAQDPQQQQQQPGGEMDAQAQAAAQQAQMQQHQQLQQQAQQQQQQAQQQLLQQQHQQQQQQQQAQQQQHQQQAQQQQQQQQQQQPPPDMSQGGMMQQQGLAFNAGYQQHGAYGQGYQGGFANNMYVDKRQQGVRPGGPKPNGGGGHQFQFDHNTSFMMQGMHGNHFNQMKQQQRQPRPQQQRKEVGGRVDWNLWMKNLRNDPFWLSSLPLLKTTRLVPGLKMREQNKEILDEANNALKKAFNCSEQAARYRISTFLTAKQGGGGKRGRPKGSINKSPNQKPATQRGRGGRGRGRGRGGKHDVMGVPPMNLYGGHPAHGHAPNGDQLGGHNFFPGNPQLHGSYPALFSNPQQGGQPQQLIQQQPPQPHHQPPPQAAVQGQPAQSSQPNPQHGVQPGQQF